jgi:transposase
MSQPFDPSKSLTALEQDSTIIVAAVLPGFKRQPLKKLEADQEARSWTRVD